MAYLEGARGTLIEDFSDSGEWTVDTGTLSMDSTHTRESLSSHVKMSAASGASTYMYRTLPSPVDMSTSGESIELWFYVDPGTTYGGTSSMFNVTQTIRLGESSSVYWQRANHGGNMHPGWNVARWSNDVSANFTANGGITSWASIDYIYIGWTATASVCPGGLAITYCTLRAGAKGARAAFLMTHDDGSDTVYTVGRDIVNSRGIHVTAYVDDDPGLTTAHMQTLVSDGHYIGNHTVGHADMTLLSEAQIQAAVQDATDAIQAITGLETHGVHGAYPGGLQNSAVHAVLNAMGNQKTWRSTGGVNADLEEGHLWPLSVASQSQEEADLATGDWATVGGTWRDIIDIATLTGEAVIALCHTPGTSMSTANFTALCDYAAVTKGLWCPNIDEWYEYVTGGPVVMTVRHDY